MSLGMGSQFSDQIPKALRKLGRARVMARLRRLRRSVIGVLLFIILVMSGCAQGKPSAEIKTTREIREAVTKHAEAAGGPVTSTRCKHLLSETSWYCDVVYKDGRFIMAGATLVSSRHRLRVVLLIPTPGKSRSRPQAHGDRSRAPGSAQRVSQEQ